MTRAKRVRRNGRGDGPRMESQARAFSGRWRIVEMEAWDRDAFDLLGPAYMAFDRGGLGAFRFIAVEGRMDCRYGDRDGKPLVEFTWDGNDELDPASGRGWAIADGMSLRGRIFIYSGDASDFGGVRWPRRVTRGARRAR